VLFSIATLREDVWKHIEPETALPHKRLEAVAKLSGAGVRVGVMLAPIIPGLTDDRENLESVVQAAKRHGAAFVGDNVLYLKPGTKEWFMPFLRETYPHLLPQYERFYRGTYAPRTYTAEIATTVAELRDGTGFSAREEAQRAQVGQLQLAM
jgi:DNA repair photolyase